jgi:hypothetical protein
VQVVSSSGAAGTPPPPALAATTFDGTNTALKVTLPAALPDGKRYRLCVHGRSPSAGPACLELNAPETWWRRGDVNLTHATAGTGYVRIFGRNFGDLSPAEPSQLPPVQLQLCPGVGVCQYQGEITSIDAVNGSDNHATFLLPGSVTIGTYTLSLESGGSVFPMNETIYVSATGAPKGPWPAASSLRVIGVNTTGQLWSALSATEAEGGGVIQLARGTYLFTNESISLPPFTVLRGAVNAAGASLATLRWDVRQLSAAATPAFFVGGDSTFAVEDLTIYTLGLYQNVIKDTHASSYCRVARVTIRADYFLRWGRTEAAYANGSYSNLFAHDSYGIFMNGRNAEIVDNDVYARCGRDP